MIAKRVEESLVLRLITLGERLKRRRDIISQNLGVSTQQWLLLLHLCHDPNLADSTRPGPAKQPLLASELASVLNVSRPNITKMINTLLEKNLIEQVGDAVDKRRKRLILSELGVQLLATLQPHRELLNTTLLDNFSQADKDHFLRYADACLTTLDEQVKQKLTRI